jgi:predicted nucleic acid-binding protein
VAKRLATDRLCCLTAASQGDTNAWMRPLANSAPKLGALSTMVRVVSHRCKLGAEICPCRDHEVMLACSRDKQARRSLRGPLSILEFDADDAAESGEIRAHLERAGTPIGVYDVLIAGQTRRRGMTLVTANVAEFASVDGLVWQDWAAA